MGSHACEVGSSWRPWVAGVGLGRGWVEGTLGFWAEPWARPLGTWRGGALRAGCAGPAPQAHSGNCRLGEPQSGRASSLGSGMGPSPLCTGGKLRLTEEEGPPHPLPAAQQSSGPSETSSETGPSGRRLGPGEARPRPRSWWEMAEGAEPGHRPPSRRPRWALGNSISWWL